MEVLFIIFSAVLSIFSIILFFKIWRMCNNVYKISKSIESDKAFFTYEYLLARVNSGDKTAISDIFKKLFVELKTVKNRLEDMGESRYRMIYGKTSSEDITSIIANYKVLVEQLGYTFPDNIDSITCSGELNKIL